VRSGKFRPIFKQVFWLFLIDSLVLGYVGSQPPEGAMVLVGRIATGLYFLYFPLLWVIGKIEKPLPLPQSIAAPVLRSSAAHAVKPKEKA
jgi:ubiquinol-cytochrome c reductase cytochrome b subunit